MKKVIGVFLGGVLMVFLGGLIAGMTLVRPGDSPHGFHWFLAAGAVIVGVLSIIFAAAHFDDKPQVREP